MNSAITGPLPFALFALFAIVAGTLLAPSGVLASANAAWRCGPEGHLYTDERCEGGREIALPAARPPADLLVAERLAARERAAGERMRREREAREAAAIAATTVPVSLRAARLSRPPAQPMGLQGRQPARSKSMSLKTAPDRGADERTWRATAPASPRSPG
jgi:hypothetical protein